MITVLDGLGALRYPLATATLGRYRKSSTGVNGRTSVFHSGSENHPRGTQTAAARLALVLWTDVGWPQKNNDGPPGRKKAPLMTFRATGDEVSLHKQREQVQPKVSAATSEYLGTWVFTHNYFGACLRDAMW